MASSGSITTNEVEGRSVTLSWTLSSQSIEKNTSTIAWTLQGSGSASGYVKSGGFKAVINGTTVYSTSTDNRIELRNGTVVASGSTTIAHNADGTKSFSLSCEAGIYSYAVSATASGTHTLTTIPRASTVSATSVNMGSASSITITRASSSFTHTLTYSFGSATGTIATKTTSTSVSWTPPLTLANQIPNAVSGKCTITCKTYNGTTEVGSKTCTMTLTVPSTVKPTITSLTAARVDGTVPSAWGIYVQSKSKATLTINGAAGAYGSTISSYSITGGGYSSTASSFTTGFLNTSGSITFTASVTDSRGRVSTNATVTITVVAYSAPSFSKYISQRCNSAGTAADNGTYIKSTVNFSYASCSSKNTITTATYYKKTTDTSWTNANKTFTSGTAFTFGGGNISAESSYEVKFTLKDAFATIEVTDTLSTASVVMDFKSGGLGVAVGKVSETDRCFEVSDAWDVKVYGMILSAYIQSLMTGGGLDFATCSTAAGTAAKVAACTGFKLETGAAVLVKFANANSSASPTLNVNSTGAKNIVTYGTTAIGTYYWKAGQVVLFLYDGTSWQAVNMSTATTSYYGITKLSSSTSSTSTTLAATASAVKAAYDRNSWDSITLTNALGLSYGGTGATTAASARSNLGIKATSLYSGTLTTGSTTFSTGYKLYVIIGQPTSSSSRCAIVLPGSQISTTSAHYQIADESNYYSFNISYSGSTITLAYRGRSSSGQILKIYGVN